MTSMASTEAPCATCQAPVTALEWVASTYPHLVRCPLHVSANTPPTDAAPAAGDLFRAGMPADVRNARLEQIDDKQLRDALTQWAADPTAPDGGRAFVMLGPAGTGKTCAAWAAIAECVSTGKLRSSDVLAGTERSLMEPMGAQSRFTGRARTWADLLRSQKVVLVDDVGYAQFIDAGARVAAWKDLLDRVCARSLTLFVTSNVAQGGDLGRILGDAATSRLVRLSGTHGPLRAGNTDRRTGHAYPRNPHG